MHYQVGKHNGAVLNLYVAISREVAWNQAHHVDRGRPKWLPQLELGFESFSISKFT